MPAKYSRHIALTAPLIEWAEARVAGGEYTSVSDLVRTAMRTLKADGDRRRSSRGQAQDRIPDRSK